MGLTTVDLDDKLLKQARRILGTTSIKDTVNASLKAVVHQRKLQELVDSFGAVDLDLTHNALRAQRRKRTHVSR
ncbi:MAG TPA: type II toxin-antitoxin system VapB family antitoxin [Candidatus Binatia bacterium]|nr:type II toxin-antitoxin system VapB family antitoxin [Candidatus Binatia bacterium]